MILNDRFPTKPPRREYISEAGKIFLASLPRRDSAIDVDALEKIGRGGAHDVYGHHGDRRFVLKVNHRLLERVQRSQSGPKEMLARLERNVGEQNARNKEVYDAFGEEDCLVEDLVLDKVLIHEDGSEKIVTTILTLQEKTHAFSDATKFDFSGPYTERETSKISTEDYIKLTRPLFSDELDRDALASHDHTYERLFPLLENDALFKHVMREFIERFRSYYAKMGTILDFVGNENVLFYQENGVWRFQLGSVFKGGGSKQDLAAALDLMETDPEAYLASDWQQNTIHNVFANARLLNATALAIGAPRIFDIPLSPKQIDVLSGEYKRKRDLSVHV